MTTTKQEVKDILKKVEKMQEVFYEYLKIQQQIDELLKGQITYTNKSNTGNSDPEYMKILKDMDPREGYFKYPMPNDNAKLEKLENNIKEIKEALYRIELVLFNSAQHVVHKTSSTDST